MQTQPYRTEKMVQAFKRIVKDPDAEEADDQASSSPKSSNGKCDVDGKASSNAEPWIVAMGIPQAEDDTSDKV